MTHMNTVLKWVKLQKEALFPCYDIPSGNISCLVYVIWEPRAAQLTVPQVSIWWFARNALPWDFNEDLWWNTTGSHSVLFYLLKHLCLPLPLSSSKYPLSQHEKFYFSSSIPNAPSSTKVSLIVWLFWKKEHLHYIMEETWWFKFLFSSWGFQCIINEFGNFFCIQTLPLLQNLLLHTQTWNLPQFSTLYSMITSVTINPCIWNPRKSQPRSRT